MAGVLVAALAAAALTLLARRLAGALAVAPSLSLTALATLLFAVMVAAVRVGGGVLSIWVSTAVVVAFGLAMSFPKAGLLQLAAVWAPILVEEAWAWGWLRRSGASLFGRAPASSAAPEAEVTRPAAAVLQQLTRSADGDAEQLAGWLRMPLATGQRSGSLHVAFCPPFRAAPQVEFEQLEGPAARIRIGQLMPYGVRLDVKLSAPSPAPAGLLLRFVARSACE
jgi:hypothetical protein